jgi:arsenate reductase
MPSVLILCTGNSCRSQMAEALWRSLSGSEWDVASAGSKPTGDVHPLAIRALAEIGLDLRGATSKSVEQFQDRPFDLVVTVCDHARETCPVFPQAEETLHWPFDDPADAIGDEETRLITFRRVRDEIRRRIEAYLSTRAPSAG